MPFRLDHVVIAVHDLDQAVDNYRNLGFNVFYGGRHASGTTHNALICFHDGTYIELLAPTGEAPRPGVIDFGVLLTGREGFVGYALLSDDLDADIQSMRARGIDIEESVPGERLRSDGVKVQWKLARIGESFAPFFIQDVTPRHLRVSDDPERITHPNGVLGLDKVDIATLSLPNSREKFENILGISPIEEAGESIRFQTTGANIYFSKLKTPDEISESLLALTLKLPQPSDEPDDRLSDTRKTHGVLFFQNHEGL